MFRLILPPLFAILLFVAHLNCVVEHQIFSVAAVGSSAAPSVEKDVASLPSGFPDEPESCQLGNCLCRGATLAVEFQLDLPSLVAGSPWGWPQRSPALLIPLDVAVRVGVQPLPDRCLPLRALDRCAALQSFLI